MTLPRWPRPLLLANSLAVALPLSMASAPASAQYAPAVAPSCSCGPSALPAYRVPYPQPAYRPLDGSQRSGVTYKEGGTFRQAQTNLGSSSYEPVQGPANWSGLYIGGHGGYAFGGTTVKDVDLGRTQTSGGFAGVHLGRNWQWGAMVLGVEGDLSKNWDSGQKAFSSGTSLSSARDWSGSARGRVGYAFGNAMAFITGGVAVAGQSVIVSNGTTQWRGPEAHIGTVYGGGLEWQIMPQLSLRGEVLRYNFAERESNFNGVKAPLKMDDTVVRAGVSFRFN